MFEIAFYSTAEGKCPVKIYLDSLSDRQVEKVLWTLRLVQELNPVPSQYLQKMSGTDDLWEVRVSHAGNIFRLLGFITSGRRLLLVNGFTKKTPKTPAQEIATARARKKDYEAQQTSKN